jgi:hypothetical protein
MEILESIRSDLTLAALPIDDLTGKMPLGKLRVIVKELGYDGILNKSGYYIFLDSNDKLLDINTLTVESKEKYYREASVLVSKDSLENNLVVRVDLFPSASYPFASNETLVRGTIVTITTIDGKQVSRPVPRAKVEIQARNLTYMTGDNGDFVFYFKGLREEDVVDEDHKKFIRMGTSTTFDLSITCEGYEFVNQPDCKAEVYKTTVIHTPPLEAL